jgi:uncharacterized phage protein (TIGR02220 family)
MVPADADLRDFEFTPMYRAKLFGSTFHAEADDAEWRAGVTLWLKSWEQTPAGTLPTGDVALCRLAELGRDLKTWAKVKSRALWKWTECSDGRLHHPIVAEIVNGAIEAKEKQKLKTLQARIAVTRKRLEQATDVDVKCHLTEELRSLSQQAKDAVTKTVTPTVTVSNRREGKGREGKGRDKEKLRGPSDPVGLTPDLMPGNPVEHVNGKTPATRALAEDARSILSFLNDKAGKRFPDSDSNVGIIVARLREGFTPKQVRQVVAMKVRAWSADPGMREYLRPETLFNRTKFSNYVGELKVIPDADAPVQGELTRERVDE